MGQEGRTLTGPAGPAFYAHRSGGLRDYVNLLHPPYTAWHLSFVVVGGCLAPVVSWPRLAWTVLAFALAMISNIGELIDSARGFRAESAVIESELGALEGLLPPDAF